MKPNVFISYRRDGGVDDARLVQQALKNRGFACFFDYSSIRSGKFNEAIDGAIRDADNFVLIVTDGAFDRCADEDDWVRREIRQALACKKNIVPVVPDGNTFAFPENLPEDLAELKNLQLKKLAKDSLFEESVDKFVAECFVGGRATEPQTSQRARPVSKRHSCLVGLLVLAALGFSFVLLCVLLGEDEGEDSKIATQAPVEAKTPARLDKPVERPIFPENVNKAAVAQTCAGGKACVGGMFAQTSNVGEDECEDSKGAKLSHVAKKTALLQIVENRCAPRRPALIQRGVWGHPAAGRAPRRCRAA